MDGRQGRALGRYELLRPLARGGMGEVFLARRKAAGLEKWLVVKRMRPERAGDARFLDLFMREARLTMSLTHQNIVPVFDFGRIDDQVFLAMERVEGKDLGSSLTRAGMGMPALLAAFIASECLQALDYAHRRKGPDGNELGIVHRDVTPRNVLLSWAGEVKLTDFGIAALASDSATRAVGTPAYMAPEQARGEALDVRADLYAVGLVLREALTGRRARRGTEKDVVLDVAKRGELDPWPVEPAVDPRLCAIVERATALDPAARYPDARAMLEELDAFIVADRAQTKGDPPARQLATWLDTLWKDAREEETNVDAQIDAGVLVSFLDDGGLDIVGTGTQRSLIATADDEPPPPVPVPSPSPEPSRSRAWLVLPVLAIAGVVVLLLARKHDEPIEKLAVSPLADAAVEIDAPPADAAAPDAAVLVDAGVADKRPVVVRPRPEMPVDAGAVTVEEPAHARKVTINSRPTWSNWTVDGGPIHAGVDTIELAPGKHTLHFTGNPYFKTDKTVTIDVPDRDGFTHVETLEVSAPASGP